MPRWSFPLALLFASFIGAPALAGVTPEQASDLVHHLNSHGKTVLFVFCREDRSFHCLSFIRNPQKQLVMNSSSELWTLPMLADSDGERDYDEPKGNTPQGIYSLDGVMPNADNTQDYGHFRRLVINFLSGEEHDVAALIMLPESSHALSWWKEASHARHLGRGNLRIHGVGYLNQNPDSNNYPFVPTWGCLTTREGFYDGIQYQDQRILLDSLMRAQGLEANYDHEESIDGYTVVIDLNGIHSNVSPKDLNFLK